MVFGLFTRKSTLDDASGSPGINANTRLPTPTPSIASVSHQSPLRFPTVLRSVLGGSTTDLSLRDSDLGTDGLAEGGHDTHSSAPPPPVTPSPPPAGPNETKALYDLMLTVPAKTLHTYTLDHLRPQHLRPSASIAPLAIGLHPDNAPRPPSPNTIAKLTTFFSTLAPPPLLHCVRCHKDFHELENEEKDKACRVAHDDESALVTRLPRDGGYETLWGCCGQIASGDGSEGPPDGWCYEGRHTTDIKRARFRADSTIHNDKLTSCLKLNCRGIRDQLPRRDYASPLGTAGRSSARRSNASPTRSQASVLVPHSARKRPRKSLREASGSENDEDAERSVSQVAKGKDKEKVSGTAGEDKDASKVVDELNSKPVSKAKSRPISRACPPSSTSTIASLTTAVSNPVVSAKERIMVKGSKRISRTLLSQSHTHHASDSEASTRSRPRTKSRVREESRGRDTPKVTKTNVSERARLAKKVMSTSEEEPEAGTDGHQESDREVRGRNRKRRRVGRD